MGSTSPRDGTFAVHKSDVSLERSHSTSESDATLKRAYRKADVRLLVWYSFVFLILKIEGHNNANAVIMNVEAGTDIRHQLGDLTSEQWALILSICQYPNILFEPVSTLLLKRFTPRKWMSRIMISWGIISMCKGATQNFGGLLACQFLLGLAEAGFLPGVLYHLSFWYPVDRLRMRIALFYAFAQLSGAISGLLAFAISYLNGKGGLAGWRYLFLLEGMPAVLCGIYSLFSLPNYPDEVQFLNEMERVRILEKLPEAQPNAGDETWDCHQIKELFTDSTTYSFLLIWSCHAIGTKGVHHCLANRYLSARVDKYDICATHDNAAVCFRVRRLDRNCLAYTVEEVEVLGRGELFRSLRLRVLHHPHYSAESCCKVRLCRTCDYFSGRSVPNTLARAHPRHLRNDQRRSRNWSHKRCCRIAWNCWSADISACLWTNVQSELYHLDRFGLPRHLWRLAYLGHRSKER